VPSFDCGAVGEILLIAVLSRRALLAAEPIAYPFSFRLQLRAYVFFKQGRIESLPTSAEIRLFLLVFLRKRLTLFSLVNMSDSSFFPLTSVE